MVEDLQNVQIKEVENGFVVEANYENEDAKGETNYWSDEFVFFDFGTAIIKIAEIMGQGEKVKSAPLTPVEEPKAPEVPLTVSEQTVDEKPAETPAETPAA